MQNCMMDYGNLSADGKTARKNTLFPDFCNPCWPGAALTE